MKRVTTPATGCNQATYYRDADGDGYGSPATTKVACAGTAPAGYAATATDCDDTSASVNPGGTDVCGNGVDEDCSGSDFACGGGNNAAQICVDKINQYRASIGVSPLARWSDKEACADGEALSDSQTGTAHGAFGSCTEFAQNECPGWPGPDETMIPGCLQAMWNEGPGADFSKHGHYTNMANPAYTKVACGFATKGDGSVWAVQDFR